jgi:nucleoside 2-deoxyribosyltransferase
MLAILDGCDSGTLFEVGYAVKEGIPVIALAQNLRASDTTMLAGSTQCHIVNDFATAVYHATWKASE